MISGHMNERTNDLMPSLNTCKIKSMPSVNNFLNTMCFVLKLYKLIYN